MTYIQRNAGQETTSRNATPVLAIMGEFSVGKSTLCNLLLGSEPLPVRVTATQLPPVWISHGDAEPYRETLEGEHVPIDLERIDDVELADTSLIRIFLNADILELCDLIDMPGISDPNMSPEVWSNVLHRADGVLWCTHATQAWRQSESAIWNDIPPEVKENSLLLITRMDKLLSERDRQKVIRRVEHETRGGFAGLFPVSLTEAIEAEYDRERWMESGAEEFSQELLELLNRMTSSNDTSTTREFLKSPTQDENGQPFVAPQSDAPPVKPVRPARVRSSFQPERPPRPDTSPIS